MRILHVAGPILNRERAKRVEHAQRVIGGKRSEQCRIEPAGVPSAQASQVAPVPSISLNSGFAMPTLGIGTWTLSDVVAQESVRCALQRGYRLIETAQDYGNEAGVGRAVREAVAAGIVVREDVFVTTKVSPAGYANPDSAIEGRLSKLGLDYIDLLLIHQPGSNDEVVYHEMERAVRDGRVRSIGISNYYTPAELDAVLAYAEIPPAVIQNENHPYNQNADLASYARKKCGAYVESWYPLGGRGNTEVLFGDATIAGVAAAHGISPAQALLRWHVQAGYIAIPGSSNPDHIAENISIFDFELTADEMAALAALDRQHRFERW
ncbi:MAG: aldo/keto reductase [Eggerthellaceae bacterium]|nr:aldo/keto reductase [Eggerthellaceae bacterium]